eukprot:SAG31_NODE_1953_length_6829_cov_6.548886_7_plen_72_part_00
MHQREGSHCYLPSPEALMGSLGLASEISAIADTTAGRNELSSLRTERPPSRRRGIAACVGPAGAKLSLGGG